MSSASNNKNAEKGMIFLEAGHPVIKKYVSNFFDKEKKPEPVDIRVTDFNSVEYHLLVDPDDLDTLFVSMRLKVYKSMAPMGAKASVDAKFGSNVENSPKKDMDITIKASRSSPPKDLDAFVRNCSTLARDVMCSPFERCFKALTAEASGNIKPMVIEYRTNETMVLVPSKDRINIYFTVDFDDETDRAIAAVFLQEFGEAPRRINNTPNCQFSPKCPADLKKVPGFKEPQSTVGYLAFQVFPRHVKGDKLDIACTLFAGFRTYLHYHVKASKSHLHARMRARVKSLLLVLNRANPALEAATRAGQGPKRRTTLAAGGNKQRR